MDERQAAHDGLARRETLGRLGAAGLGLSALGGGLDALLARTGHLITTSAR